MDENTIMPDGRPLFAWENELNILRSEKVLVDKQWNDNFVFSTAMSLIYQQWEDPQTLDWLLRYKVVDSMTVTPANFYESLKKYLHICPQINQK